MDLEDLINAFKNSNAALESGFNRQVKDLKVSMHDKDENPLSLAVLEGMPLHLTRETIHHYQKSPVIRMLESNELVLIPLKAKDRVNGIIVADNFITKDPITKDDLRMLTMLANQAVKAAARGTIEVLVDSGTARDNVSRAGRNAGWTVTVEDCPDGSYRILFKR